MSVYLLLYSCVLTGKNQLIFSFWIPLIKLYPSVICFDHMHFFASVYLDTLALHLNLVLCGWVLQRLVGEAEHPDKIFSYYTHTSGFELPKYIHKTVCLRITTETVLHSSSRMSLPKSFWTCQLRSPVNAFGVYDLCNENILLNVT